MIWSCQQVSFRSLDYSSDEVAGGSATSDAILASFKGLDLPASLEGAALKRKIEFLAGRQCARQAMQALLNADEAVEFSIGIGKNREPLWPKGWVGSITHTEGYAAAAVGRATEFRSLGLDAERILSERTIKQISRQILTPYERDQWSDPRWVSLAFSAKESLFKCLHPLLGKYFGFQAAQLNEVREGNLGTGEFCLTLTESLSPEFFAGWEIRGRFVLSQSRILTGLELKLN